MITHLQNEPLELFVYPDGIAVLWREGTRYRVYHSGDVLLDSENEAEAMDAFNTLCSSLEKKIMETMPRLKYGA